MSYITLPDPDQGRCKNFRLVGPSPATGEMLPRRCLELDHHTGSCRFKPLPRPVDQSRVDAYVSTKSPQPWKVPK